MITLLAVLGVHVVAGILLVTSVVWLRRNNRREVQLSTPPQISIVVPARNEAENLRRLLPSLLAQRYPFFEVILYDDGSEDATWEVIRNFGDTRLHTLRGEGPPPGWVGKVHALYTAARNVSGDVILFFDADVVLEDTDALWRLAARFESLPPDSVLSGFTLQRGRALLLVSLLPFTILSLLPVPLVFRLPHPSLSALNGQCWMISRLLYRRLEPHEHCRADVLEDVEIGRYLKTQGVRLHFLDLQNEVSVYMYRSFVEAWRGFRKNAYLLMGGRPASFWPLFVVFTLTLTIAPLISPWLLVSVFALKFASDRFGRFPVWVSLLAPLSFALSTVLQLDSAVHHWLGRVSWKGRPVG